MPVRFGFFLSSLITNVHNNESYIPGGKITFRSRLSLSRFFSVSRPLTLLSEAVVITWVVGIGILMGRPAFLWRIDSSNNDFNCTSDSLDFECSSLKEIVLYFIHLSFCQCRKQFLVWVVVFQCHKGRKWKIWQPQVAVRPREAVNVHFQPKWGWKNSHEY